MTFSIRAVLAGPFKLIQLKRFHIIIASNTQLTLIGRPSTCTPFTRDNYSIHLPSTCSKHHHISQGRVQENATLRNVQKEMSYVEQTRLSYT